MNMYIIWIMLAELPTLPVIRNERPPRPCSATRSKIRDFAAPIAARASKIFGPISLHLIAQILPMMCNAARASRPGLAVGVLRCLCNGMCAAQRLHMDGVEQRCRARCQALSHIAMNALFSTTSSPLLGDMLQFGLGEAICFTTSSLKSFQEASNMGSLLWVLLTFLSTPTTTTAEIWIIQGTSEIARKRKNPVYDCYHSNIRPCVPVYLPDVAPSIRNFACPVPKPGIRTFPTLEPQHVKKATFPRMCHLHRKLHIIFGRVITTEAHVAFAGTSFHSNNTAELSNIVETLSFLGPHGLVARDSTFVYFL